jgi:hypothetical protein
MTPTSNSIDTMYRIATDHQADLRHEAATANATLNGARRSVETLPPTRGPLATIRRRLAGTASFA